MKKIVNRKFNVKKLSLYLSLALSLVSLTGCKDKNKDISTAKTTEIKTEVSTEQIFEEKNNKYRDLAIDSYNIYNDFYSSIDVNLDQVETMIRVINDDTDGLTQDEVYDSIAIIDRILLSDQLQQKIDNINYMEHENIEMNDGIIIPQTPTLVPFIKNEQIKNYVGNYENIRNNIQVAAMNGHISDEQKQLLKDEVVKTEERYDNDALDINNNTTSEGEVYIQESWKYRLIELTTIVTGETQIEKTDGTLITIAPNDEERDALAIYETASMSGQQTPEYVEKTVYEYKLKSALTKYNQGMCDSISRMNENITKNINTSKIDLLNIKKDLLQQKLIIEEANNKKYINI